MKTRIWPIVITFPATGCYECLFWAKGTRYQNINFRYPFRVRLVCTNYEYEYNKYKRVCTTYYRPKLFAKPEKSKEYTGAGPGAMLACPVPCNQSSRLGCAPKA